MQCSFCGQKNDTHSRFCSGCGQPLSQISNPSQVTTESPFKTAVTPGFPSTRIPSPDGKLDSQGSTIMVHPDGTIVNNRYALYYLTAGGMGAVYLARDINTEEMFIIKEAVSSSSENQLKLIIFLTQEREALIRLKHPAIVQAHDFFIDGGACYLVLEYVDGDVMEHVIQQKMPEFMDEETALAWAIQIADVLDYLHNQDPPIIYRDLKPDNLMVDRENNIKVIDFGATRVYKEGRDRDTRAIGTAGFAAPEQYGSSQTDCRSDIYSLGATMHYLLTNRYPGDMPFVFPLVRSINPGVSDRIDMIIQKAVQPDMKHRYSSALEMKTALIGEDGEKCYFCSSLNRKDYKFCKKCGKKPSSLPKPPSAPDNDIKISQEKVQSPEKPELEKPQKAKSEIRSVSRKSLKKGDSEESGDFLRTTIPLSSHHTTHDEALIAEYKRQKSMEKDREKRKSETQVIEQEIITKEEILPEIKYETEPFIFKNGKNAYDIYELIELCRRYPEEGKYHLRRLEFTPWFQTFGIPDYGLEEIITQEFPEYDLVYFCAVVLEYIEDMKLKKELPYLDERELEDIAKKHKLLTIFKDLPALIVNTADQSEMLLIPQGEFLMGKEKGHDNEKHTVYLDAYYIDKFPITNLQYERFTRETRYKSEGDWKRYYTTGMAYYPVTCVTWKDASSYLKWSGKRLPTEAEWEKAARGTDGRLFPWGNKWENDRCNNLLLNKRELLSLMCNMEEGRGTIPVGSTPEGKSPYGVEDMAGNVNEWCHDWYDQSYYQKSPAGNPQGPPGGKFKVNRGGSWRGGSFKSEHIYFFECSFRSYNKPNDRIGFYGFRGVKDI